MIDIGNNMLDTLRLCIRRALPNKVLHVLARWKLKNSYKDDKTNKELFSKIYASKQWGGDSEGSPFYSGTGSESYNTEPYVDLVREFIKDNNVSKILDLGCGDFRVGTQLVKEGVSYIGVDVVEELIEYNNANFSNEKTNFLCMDVSCSDLPPGDLVLIRQVLQHLNNEDVKKTLEQVKNYAYAIITDEIPNNDTHSINKDVVRGGTRFERDSGLYVEHPPFDLPAEVVLDYPNHRGDRRLRTVLYKRPLT